MKPLIGITMGDPGGVGPEVIIKALARPDVRDVLRPVIIGNMSVLESTANRLGVAVIFREEKIGSVGEARAEDVISVWDPAGGSNDFVIGQISAENGRVAHAYIVAAAEAALENRVDGICTAPISKEAMFADGFKFPGHTELLADLCGGATVRMMLVGGGLRVVLQTIHVPLKDVAGLITVGGIVESLGIIRDHAAMVGERNARIGVCGLNPHAGEAGHFGREELDVITPAVETAARDGMLVSGPFPADTVFHRMLQGDFDFVLAMYHDQGLIPVKTLDFHGGVNVTLGLPIIRTSPDHGTAFNIAGMNQANESSMAAALKYAAKLVEKRRA